MEPGNKHVQVKHLMTYSQPGSKS